MTDIKIKQIQSDKPMNPAEAAEYLGMAKGSLYNLVHFKKITYYQPGGRRLYFLKKDLDTYIRRGIKLADFEVNRKAEDILNA